ncbi:DUF1648 domain-containing protein [Corynebacterium rouxii]|uniref:DUF1648 domain-containing protein n=1 Tax=Corynebacterium rouxii TaxID=2719119 RepID=UPI002F966561
MAATLITLIVISIAIGRYGFVSDPMPVHFGANGQPDGFQPKSWGSYLLVFAVPGVLLLGIQWGIWHFSVMVQGKRYAISPLEKWRYRGCGLSSLSY